MNVPRKEKWDSAHFWATGWTDGWRTAGYNASVPGWRLIKGEQQLPDCNFACNMTSCTKQLPHPSWWIVVRGKWIFRMMHHVYIYTYINVCNTINSKYLQVANIHQDQATTRRALTNLTILHIVELFSCHVFTYRYSVYIYICM